MATRTFQLMGSSNGTFTVDFNNTQVFAGSADSDEDVLCTFTADTTVNGNIPLVVTVNSGSETIVKGLHANYVRFLGQQITEGVDAAGNPITITILADDVTSTFGPMGNYAYDAVLSPRINNETELAKVYGFNGDSSVLYPGIIWRYLELSDVFTCDMVVDPITVAVP